MLKTADILAGSYVCDIGACVCHLTLPLARRKIIVLAVDPNYAMRARGVKQTLEFEDVQWHEGTAEDTIQEDSYFDLVTFGSSFNVTNRAKALQESRRILKSNGWFACMWNHRDLNDPVQSEIENIIKSYIRDYDYGSRREDQTSVINSSGLFRKVHKIEGNVYHKQKVDACIEAWRSHATLMRQAGEKFDSIVMEIERFLKQKQQPEIVIPYTTRIWLAQVKSEFTDMKIIFSTKAETLERLSTVLTTAKILPQIRMTVAEWHADPHGITEHIRNNGWFDIPLIVRSSALAEDSENESLAGHFTSVSNVIGEKGICNAVGRVIESYTGRNGYDQQF